MAIKAPIASSEDDNWISAIFRSLGKNLNATMLHVHALNAALMSSSLAHAGMLDKWRVAEGG